MLIDLAEHQNNGFIALKDIAARQGISKKYLEQIVPVLNRSDILQTNRGFQGGYKLAGSLHSRSDPAPYRGKPRSGCLSGA